ncbi:hypothetical protein [Ruegeria atlantica]|uniref:hypothetical protein n=1 Tax=Ruegeria atlantica TaxID=81569 RepID=UPI0014805D35|nr:hypothetical protein [Ruegeria atlantica]
MTGSVPRRKTARTVLPPRRPAETRKLSWAGQTVYVTVGYDADHLRPREIFYNGGYRSGSDMEALVSDLCIALSVMLQHDGVTAASLARSMSTAVDLRTGTPKPAAILGLLLAELERPPAWSAELANRLRDAEQDVDGPQKGGSA